MTDVVDTRPARDPVPGRANGKADDGANSFNPEAFALNMARAMESGGKALAAYLQPRQTGEVQAEPSNEMTEIIKTFSTVANYWLSDEKRSTELQMKLGKAYLDLWGTAMRRMTGETSEPSAQAPLKDKRFKDPEWKSNQFFDFVLQAYLLGTQWAHELVRN